MKGLHPKDKEILLLISQAMPQGIIPSLCAKQASLTPQNLNSYLQKLLRKTLLRKEKRGILTYYFISEAGQNALLFVGSPKPFILPSKPHIQRPHAIQVNARLFRTSWDRLEPTLTSLSISYHKELKGNLIRFNFQGREWRATNQWLYAVQELDSMPLNVPISEVLHKAVLEAGPLFEAFLAKTGLRCVRNKFGELEIVPHYWENGYPGNEIAEESLKDKERIVYAYDLHTGKARAWADSSLGDLKELETNSEQVDTQMKAFIQAIENKEIEPYKDEIQTRRDIDGLKEIASTILNNQQSQLQWFKHHDEQIVADRKEKEAITRLVNRLDNMLRQRRL